MTQKSETGKIGEDLACRFLRDQGYRIIDRNFKRTFGELDIICQDPDRTLVFVEVKTMKPFYNSAGNLVDPQLKPEDQMSRSKFLKTAKIAAAYAASNKNLIQDDRGWRIDLVAISIESKNTDIRHYKNISV